MKEAGEAARRVEQRFETYIKISETRTRGVIEQAKREAGHSEDTPVASAIAPYIGLPCDYLPPERKAEFQNHVRSVISDSFAETHADEGPPAPPEKDPDYAERLADEEPELRVLDAACIACQGDCCLHGRNTQAFLEKETIDYVRWQNPEMNAEDIFDLYMSHLPERSIVNSCVYHGNAGCTLMRSVRANICNSYQCRFRSNLIKEYAENPGNGTVVAGIAQDHVSAPEAGAPYLRVVSMSEAGEVRVHTHLELPELPTPNNM
ncbi:hypothetical protein [Marivita hallyeonensis]|uniref:hypothetical protein n=1 Tax=Marivita hallyeonensis TaxID=996342 RepID=UPI0009348EBE|nr:hypothetical protein [Marivita hallyeonensis]